MNKATSILMVFLGCATFFSAGCKDNFTQASQSYERSVFEDKLGRVLENEGYAFTEFWENAPHIEPIPKEIKEFHAGTDFSIASKSTAHFVASTERKEILSAVYWIIDDQVSAIKIIAEKKESLDSLRSLLDASLPGIVIMQETKV